MNHDVDLLIGQLKEWVWIEGIAQSSIERIVLGMEATAAKNIQYAHPLQTPSYYFPGLRASPWHDARQFHWTRWLEDAFGEIKAEFWQVGKDGLPRHPEGAIYAGDWNRFLFFNLGSRLHWNCARCPRTAALLEKIPGVTSAGLAYFSAAAPGTHIKPHCGPHNARLRCHLGIVAVDGAEMRVGDETRSWQEGKCLVFDDSFEHEVWNRGETMRVILILDVWHPDLSPIEIAALEYIRATF
jgi:aspartyl/asparaginyl beta-hydroxylase (cupin superfamily)